MIIDQQILHGMVQNQINLLYVVQCCLCTKYHDLYFRNIMYNITMYEDQLP